MQLTGLCAHVIEETGLPMGKRILVADDSLTIQRAVAMVMDGFGYSLSFARSVDEAMMVAKRDGRPDLVLADVALGSGSGYDLCAELKANADWRDVPVFMLASTQSPYDESRGRQAGADGHMAKPFESQALLDAVASALADPGRTGVMPELVDREENTTRMSARPGEANDDDSYGEISIERGPARAPAVVPWGDGKPEGAASTAPPPAVGPVPPAARPSPRPSLIPGAHSPSSLPSAGEDKGQPVSSPASSPPAATVRAQMARTMMGFPSVKPPGVVAKPATAASSPERGAVLPNPLLSGPTPAMGIPAVSSPSPAARTSPSGPSFLTPAAPVPPRFSGLPTSASPATPAGRPAATPGLPPQSSRAASPLPAVPSPGLPSLVEQKLAAVAGRGPEYEVIAKLSREIIEQVVWEVVPELAEAIIRQEVDRLASAKK